MGAYIHGFGGDDLVYGTNSRRTRCSAIDGDDTLYSFLSTESTATPNGINPESLPGGEDATTSCMAGARRATSSAAAAATAFGVIYSAGNAALQVQVDLTTGQAAERAAPKRHHRPGESTPRRSSPTR